MQIKDVNHKLTDDKENLSRRGLPTRKEAEDILKEAETHNPGKWVKHSENVAVCAEKIAKTCGMDGEKAYILGLLHDIGRRFGTRHLGHVYDGYKYMLSLGFYDVAKICLTHSFCNHDFSVYFGNLDVTESEQKEIEDALNESVFDDYDRLIQLCDGIGSAEGIVGMEIRMNDIKSRYGTYPQVQWDKNLELKSYFEKLAKVNDIYEILK